MYHPFGVCVNPGHVHGALSQDDACRKHVKHSDSVAVGWPSLTSIDTIDKISSFVFC
jgi:hypothetical protein